MTNGSLMKVKSIAELEHSSTLLTCVTQQLDLEKQFYGLFESGRFSQVLLYSGCKMDLIARKPDRCLQLTKVQTSLHICTVLSLPLLLDLWKVN